MKSIYDLREMLCEELENMTEQRSLSGDKLKVIDMLTHSIKSIDTIIAMENSGYSNDYHDDRDRGRSYAARRRDDRGRYSRDDAHTHLKHQLEDMLDEVHSDKEREAIKRCIEQMS
jgi:hypothetical protein